MSFVARNHPQQVGKRGALDKVDDRRTPRAQWREWDREFGFTLDAAASRENALCRRFYTLDDDGLTQPWSGVVWCNPPYSDCGAWVKKATLESLVADVIVMLLPANRTEQGWWQKWIEPRRRDRGGDIEVRFLPGRMRFDVPDGTYSDPRGNRPPFGCCLVIWPAGAVRERRDTRVPLKRDQARETLRGGEVDRAGTTGSQGWCLGGSRAAGRPQTDNPRET